MIDAPTADRIATVFHALGESTRLLIIRELISGAMCVNAIAKAVGRPVVNVSHHLGVMRNAGVVTCERSGRERVYAINPDLFTLKGLQAVLVFEGVRVLMAAPNKGQKSSSVS